MKDRPQHSSGGFSEYSEPVVQHSRNETSITGAVAEQLLLDYLLDMGFTQEVARKLLDLREHLYENAEMRQRMADNYRMQFARWLREQGEIKEE